MPFYEYQCEACEHVFEVLQKISDAPIKKCPECGKSKAKKLVSAAGFQLKGGGWYVTDFKNKPASEDKSAKSETKTKDKKSETKTDVA